MATEWLRQERILAPSVGVDDEAPSGWWLIPQALVGRRRCGKMTLTSRLLGHETVGLYACRYARAVRCACPPVPRRRSWMSPAFVLTR
jgi:hypothetical protein